ncbi:MULTISPECIES: MFS transporter [unclassified Janthinobacterium]|uniref:MFS transporter n=1 Tax=unclassified Janthinobacterium TaxID=2610881 RepID=UPI00160C7EEC|nr:MULTISPECIES: MFS transporter [unclassified Janthinobacterium]MBB5609499.1 EmrB/QacA subfamily drug resistance transporter [Janthinobacterium sp. S3T4]MBB5614654.1 EmrB/QacA subfamily drug resistance transporter [Janthinobacterium sp. S3M3]
MLHTPRSSSQKAIFTLAAVCLASLMFGLEISSVPVILPTLEAVLHGGFKDLQWIMNAYTIACTGVLMATGTLADRYGRKRVFLISLALFGITSLLCGLASSSSMLIAGRFLQGMAGGAMLICQVAVLSQHFPSGAARGKAFSAWGIVFGIGLGFGPIIGAAIVALSNWQWVFLVHAPLAVLSLALVIAGVVESRDTQQRKLDVAGIATLSLAVFGLAWGITQGAATGFGDSMVIASLAAALASCMLFVLVQRRSSEPMMDFSVFRIRRFSGALLGSAGMNFSFWPCMMYLPLYFSNGLGYASVGTGAALLAYTLPTLLVPPLGERLALRYRPDTVVPAGLFTIGLGFLLMYWGSSAAHASWLTMLPGCLLAGIGLGLTNTPVTNTTTGAVPPERAGMASSIDISARMISLSINIALMGFILLQGILSSLREQYPALADAAHLRHLALALTAGQVAAGLGVSAEMASMALAHGFGWVMLYGGLSAWGMALASWLVFGANRAAPEPALPV